jgi:hypothetical protein
MGGEGDLILDRIGLSATRQLRQQALSKPRPFVSMFDYVRLPRLETRVGVR